MRKYIRENKSGNYEVRMMIDGESHSHSYKTLKEANAKVKELLALKASPKLQALRKHTIGNAIDYALEDTAPKSSKYYSLNRLKKLLNIKKSDPPLERLTHGTVAKFIERLKTLKSKRDGEITKESTQRRHYFHFKRAIERYARHNDLDLNSNIFVGHKLPRGWKDDETAVRYTDEDIQNLKKAADGCYTRGQDCIDYLDLLLQTGMRPAELNKLCWKHFTASTNQLTALPFKSRSLNLTRQVPLSAAAGEVLKERYKRLGNPDEKSKIFGGWKSSAIHGTFSKLRKRAGYPDFVLHHLRHEALSRMVEIWKDVSIGELMKITGHTDPKTFNRYLRFHGRTERMPDL